MRQMTSIDPVTLNLWYPIVAIGDAKPGIVGATRLLEQAISFAVDSAGQAAAWKSRPDLRAGDPVDIAAVADPLPSITAYGYLWTSLGSPAADIFPIPQYAEPDRRNIAAASIGVNVSAPRAIENFLDMGHFPYVHTDILGVEPHTEVKEYDVEISVERDEIVATRCRFFQPMASTVAQGGADVEYIYRVPHPYLLGALQIEPARRAAHGRDRHLPAADRPGAYPRAHDAVRARRPERRQLHPALPADDLRPGQADPGEPVSQAPAARPARRNADPRRQVGHRLPPLAQPEGHHLRRHPGCRLRVRRKMMLATPDLLASDRRVARPAVPPRLPRPVARPRVRGLAGRRRLRQRLGKPLPASRRAAVDRHQ